MLHATPQRTQQINTFQSQHKKDMHQTVSESYILCGRGSVNAKHPGNRVFAQIIQSSIKDYVEADSKMAKVIVVASVVDFIHGNGMKFVTYDKLNKTYDQLSSERIRPKVSHAIRDQIKQNKKEALRSRVTLRAEKQQRRATSPINLALVCESKMYDEFDAWGWSQHENECCKNIVNHSTPSYVISSRIEEPPVCKSIFDDEGDFLSISRTIFDLGSKIEEDRRSSCCAVSTSMFDDIMDTPPPLSHATEAIRTVSGEISSDIYSLSAFPSSFSIHEEEAPCLPADSSEPEFEDEDGGGDDVETIFSLSSLDNDEGEIEPLSLVYSDYFPDYCYSSQVMF